MIRFDKKKTASFDIDAEKCFTPLCPNELPVFEGDLIADELNAQAKFARLRLGSKDAHNPQALWVTQLNDRIATPISNDRLAMYKQVYTRDADNVDLYWAIHGVPGTLGFELLDGLPKPTEYDYFVWKGIELNMHPYGACYHDLKNKLSTGALEFLEINGIEVVIVGGLAYEYCVGLTIIQLMSAGFKVILNEASTRGLTKAGVDAMRLKLKDLGVIFIQNASELENLIY